MKIEPKSIKVKDIFDGYADNGDNGVFAYDGRLAIRPAYQREFVYSSEQAESVIHTILKGFPLNVMYWVKVGDDQYEVLDGQQRTLSVMQYLDHKYSISVDGEKLTDQELRNSVYTGKWLTDAKRYFSKRNCAAKGLSDKYIKADPNRQELLEKALMGICGFQGIDNITEYMSIHKSDDDADELWQYFQDVINWVQKIFPKYYNDMKGLDWCSLYNKYHNNTYNSSAMKTEVEKLHQDDEVQKRKGIYEYLLCKDKDPFAGRLLNLRAFDNRDKMAVYERQQGLCNICGEHFEYDEMEGDHIKPWSKGGRTILDNCQMLCKSCNAKKTDKY